MKNAAAILRASYSDWKPVKSRRVIQVVFEVPWEAHDAAYQALGGMPDPAAERWFGIARLVDGANAHAPREAERELPDGDAPASRPRRPVAPEKQLAQQAGICCGDPVFRRFLASDMGVAVMSEESAAEFVRGYCGVETRSLIRPNSPAGDAWRDLHSRFLLWRDHDLEVPRQDHQREQVG